MKKQYYVVSKYNHKDKTSALMKKMSDNVYSELYEMCYSFDKGNTAESYKHYKNALAELNKLSFKEMKQASIKVNIANWVHNYDQN